MFFERLAAQDVFCGVLAFFANPAAGAVTCPTRRALSEKLEVA